MQESGMQGSGMQGKQGQVCYYIIMMHVHVFAAFSYLHEHYLVKI